MSASEPSKPTDLETLFLECQPVLNAAIRAVGRRRGMDDEELDDFGGWFRLEVIASGYRLLQLYRGEADLAGYITACVHNACNAYCNKFWHRHRPSKPARDQGPLAVRLEQLIVRDRVPERQAIAIVANGDESVARQLRKFAGQLVLRARPTAVGLEAVDRSELSTDVDWYDGSRDERATAVAALRKVLEGWPAQDRLIVQLRLLDDRPVAEIATGLHIGRVALYRRIERLKRRLRRDLIAARLDSRAVRLLFGQPE